VILVSAASKTMQEAIKRGEEWNYHQESWESPQDHLRNHHDFVGDQECGRNRDWINFKKSQKRLQEESQEQFERLMQKGRKWFENFLIQQKKSHDALFVRYGMTPTPTSTLTNISTSPSLSCVSISPLIQRDRGHDHKNDADSPSERLEQSLSDQSNQSCDDQVRHTRVSKIVVDETWIGWESQWGCEWINEQSIKSPTASIDDVSKHATTMTINESSKIDPASSKIDLSPTESDPTPARFYATLCMVDLQSVSCREWTKLKSVANDLGKGSFMFNFLADEMKQIQNHSSSSDEETENRFSIETSCVSNKFEEQMWNCDSCMGEAEAAGTYHVSTKMHHVSTKVHHVSTKIHHHPNEIENRCICTWIQVFCALCEQIT
jgi:hypothetical protein